MKIFLLEVISQSKKRNRNRKIINEIQNKNMRELRKRGGFGSWYRWGSVSCISSNIKNLPFKTMKFERRDHLLFQRKVHQPSINDFVHVAL